MVECLSGLKSMLGKHVCVKAYRGFKSHLYRQKFIMHYVYFLLLNNNQIYKGSTSRLKERYTEHQQGKVKSTRHKRPLKLIGYEVYCLKSDAERRKKFLKTTEGRRLFKQQHKIVLNQLIKNNAGSPGHTTGRPVE